MLAVWFYAQSGYRIVNKPLHEDVPLTREQSIFASLIYSGVAKAPLVTKPVLRKATIPEELKEKYLKGNIVRYKTFLSTAQDYVSMSAMPHLKGRTDVVTFHIQPRFLAHAIQEMSPQLIESEAVFLPGSTFIIKEIVGSDIYLEEVDGSKTGFDFEASNELSRDLKKSIFAA